MEDKVLDTAIKREAFWRAIANGAKSVDAYKQACTNAEYWHDYVVRNVKKEPNEGTTKSRG